MSDLLTSDDGRNAILIAQRYLLQRRLSRHFKRNLVIAYNEWLEGNGFGLDKLLAELNEAHDPEIINLYRLLGLVGGIPASVQDTDIYVDAVDGSDTEGDGTADHPFATLWFIEGLPKRINHMYNILFVNDYVQNYALTIDVEFGRDGYLSFVGVGAPEVISGPYEIAATGLIGGSFTRYIQFTTPLAADYSNEFIMAIDGFSQDRAQAIHSLHAADTIICPADAFSTGLNVGDTMQVVRPVRLMQVRELVCSCKNRAPYTAIVRDGGKISFFNLKLAIANSNDARDSLLIDNECAQLMSFVQIIPPANGTWRITQRAELNTQNAESLSAAKSECGINNLNTFGAGLRIAGVTCQDIGKSYVLYVEGAAQWVSTRGIIDVMRGAEIDNVSCERLRAWYACASLSGILCQGRVSANIGAGLEVNSSQLSISGMLVLASDNVITVNSNSQLTLNAVGAVATYSAISQYGLYFIGAGSIEIRDDGAMLTGMGAVNDIYFATVNPGVAAAIPAAYGWANDAQNSVVKRLSS